MNQPEPIDLDDLLQDDNDPSVAANAQNLSCIKIFANQPEAVDQDLAAENPR